ncbi:MAG: metal ABC transporter ATP-binding protein [Wenzhouxiangella sp.]
MSKQAAIEFSDVDFRYGVLPVLEKVSLRVEAGEFWALLGPNGGGKTTLVKLALGLLTPASGRIRILGQSPTQARARVGYVPQFATFPRDFPLAVEKVVLQGRLDARNWWRPMGPAHKSAVGQALERVGIVDLVKRPISTLSGGQLQRVLIARALAAEPELLLLDEPTAHVDTDAETNFFDLLANLRDQMAIVMVSHDVGLVSRHVDRVACLNKKLEWHGAVPLGDGALAQLYGTPASLVDHRRSGAS